MSGAGRDGPALSSNYVAGLKNCDFCESGSSFYCSGFFCMHAEVCLAELWVEALCCRSTGLIINNSHGCEELCSVQFLMLIAA